jgi:hypothetical protein
VIIPASCSPQITKIVPEHTRKLFPTITSSVTSTTNPTKTPIPTKTLYPTLKPNPIPVTIWATDLPQPIQLQDFLGTWSPVSNSLTGVLRHDNLTTGSLVLLEAPTFSISKLDPQHTDKVLPEITISPDGSQILYGVALEPEQVDLLFDISGVMLRLDKRTGKTIPTNYSFLRGLSFWGWMDDQTVIITSYSGGGHVSIASWNYETKKSLLQDTLPVYSLGTLHYPYAAVNGFMTIGYMAYSQPKKSPRLIPKMSKHFHKTGYPAQIKC